MSELSKISASLIIAALVMTSLSSCKKYSEGPTISIIAKEVRVDNLWKVDKFITPTGTELVDTANTLYKFTRSGQVIWSNNKQAFTGNWEFGDKKKTIILDFIPFDETYTILRLKNREMWLERIDNGAQVQLIPF